MMKVIFSICISISITSANSLGLTSFTSANKMGFPSISTSPNNAIYGNHPFASRILKVEGAIGIDSLDDVDGFENIRIGFDNIDGLPQSVVDVILVPAFAKIQRALQVVPVAAGTTITTSSTTAFGTPNSDIPSQYNSPGESDVDFFMLVYQDQEFCGENTLAFARTVEIDSFDRPTYGAMNLCGSNFDTNGDPDTINFFQMIVIHETFHALGFSSEMLCRFRDPQTGKPLTPRDSNGNCQMVERDCVGDSGRIRIRAPSENYFAPGSDAFGKLSYYLSTPKVLSIVRAHFNCPTLPGLMFENIPTSDSCFGDHADEQVSLTQSPLALRKTRIRATTERSTCRCFSRLVSFLFLSSMISRSCGDSQSISFSFSSSQLTHSTHSLNLLTQLTHSTHSLTHSLNSLT